jgi:diguanylate cyclase (GGDEF)-like protein
MQRIRRTKRRAPKSDPSGPAQSATFPSDVDAAAKAVLRATTAPDPVTGEHPVAPDSEISIATPHAIVFPVVIRPDRATLTAISGRDAGKTFPLDGDEIVLGRGTEATLRLDEPSVSRVHARITCSRVGRSYVLEDLGSTNGTFVGGRRIRRTALASGDRVQVGRECVFRFAVIDEAEESLQRRLYESSMKDTLTSLANRRALFDRLASELLHARREERALSVLVVDIDRFKSINDTFGHQAGDQVIQAIAMRGAQVIRAGDLFARYGGEEFAVIARDADKREAVALAERLRRAISGMQVEVGGGSVAVTVSIGVAGRTEAPGNTDPFALFERADARLYIAKITGRDRVIAEG